MEWEEDYNINYAQYTGSGKKRRRSKTTPVILGFDVKIDISKRTQYCQENGMPIENYLHQEPTWQQTVAITADADFNLHFADGTNEPNSQGGDHKILIDNPDNTDEDTNLPGSANFWI